MRTFGLPVPPAFAKPLRACRGHIAAAVGFSALVNVLYLAPTLYMMQVYDRVVTTGGLITLYWLTALLAVAIAVLAALDALRVRLMIRASLRLDRLLAPVILERCMMRAGPEGAAAGGAMRQFDLLRQTVASPVALALFDVPWTPLYVGVAFLIHPLLGLLVLAGGAVLVALAVVNQRAMRRRADRAHDAAHASYLAQEAGVREAELVRALGMRRALVARQLGERRAGFAATLEMQFSGGRYNAAVKFVRMLMQSLALGAGAWLAVNGAISVGAIIAASVLLARALQPVEQLVGGWPQMVAARQALRSLGALLGTDGDAATAPTALPPPNGDIALVGVAARGSDPGALILRGVSVSLERGEALGIIGPSGAGKTTLARIFACALPPDAGEVRIDGASPEQWEPDELARHIGYLPQNCALLPGTVGENIARFALPGPGPEGRARLDEAIVAAARRAGVHELVIRLPGGYDARVGLGGVPLSAGQTQRVALARALFGDPRILVLDEPNSALDAEGEDALARALAHARLAGVTVVLVAHRASALQNVDRLLVLCDGAVAQCGPREAVLEELARRSAARNVVAMPERA